MTPHQILINKFGFSEFRTGQKEIIDAILNEKQVIAVMPTGAGKSICYQIPAIMKETFSIVISPLISLMQDQVDTINLKSEYAAFINSSLDYSGTQKVLRNIADHKIKLLYISPEKLSNLEFTTTLANMNPHFLFVDEAHCISQWGHNFRPSYRNIKKFADSVGVTSISAFTATATPDVRNDIIKQLEFNDPSTFVYGFERENLSLNVELTKEKKDKVLRLVNENRVPTIVYASTRKNCEQLTEFLKINGLNTAFYHAGLSTELRKVIQDDFIKNNIDVIVATNAFGMGIDKKDIGLVIHYNIPGSIENLYQEFGRAGREGQEAKCFLFFSEKDKHVQEYFININYPTIDQIKACYNAILDYHKIAVNSKSNDSLIVDIDLEKLLESKSVSENLFNSILTVLEKNGYLKIREGSQVKPKFKFLITNEQLKHYVKKVRIREMKNFLLTLIQYYGAFPFTQYVNINYQEIYDISGEQKHKIDEYLNKLMQIGIIDVNRMNNNKNIEMLSERVPQERLSLTEGDVNLRIDHAKQMLESIMDYCFYEDCRFKYILRYFGEDTGNYKCGKCDNCRGKNSINSQTSEYLSELIIRTFKEFEGGLTSSRLINILNGKSKSVIARSVSTYQTCTHYSNEEIEQVILLLISRGLLKEIGGKIFFDPIEELVELDNNNDPDSSNSYESDLELYNKLREERKLAVKKFSQNAELICSDKILKKIVQAKPTTPSEFLTVKDVNQRMFNKIGLEFLEIIKEHKTSKIMDDNITYLPQHISQTFKLFKKGYSLSEISNLLKLPESIVSIQIESIVNYYPDEDYTQLLNDEEFSKIKNMILQYGENVKDIKQHLPNSISYAKIRIVQAVVSVAQSSG